MSLSICIRAGYADETICNINPHEATTYAQIYSHNKPCLLYTLDVRIAITLSSTVDDQGSH